MTAKPRPAATTDWANDFDPFDPRWVSDPYPIWNEIRETCPVAAHTDRYVGAYFFPRYEDIRTIVNDTEHFSSRRVSVRATKTEPPVSAPPITRDPPDHAASRMILLPPLTPKAVARHEDHIRKICRDLLDRLEGMSRCDAAVDYAQEIPTQVMARFLGVPEADGPQFRHWVHQSLELGLQDAEAYSRATGEMNAYLADQVKQRRGEETDDYIGYLTHASYEGRGLSDQDIINTLRLLLLAGIDTTWSAIGASIWHLAGHQEDLKRLTAEPELLPTAMEEFLRAYAPATMAREIVKDVEVRGCPLNVGEMAIVSYPMANRDPAVFPDADKVIIDRKVNRHVTFGLGIHRCIGSNLARLELRVALEEWLARIPRFSLDPAGPPVTWSASHLRGPKSIPIVLG
ncbi:MAG: cytochrome [Caulobacteraceae bacterium]|nr:cytochrome [Caulobacteraceae bacterium]